MLKKFLKTVEENNIFKKGEGIVVGVSGGPDSISLLHLLYRIRDAYDLNIYVVHLNHQFRGEDADQDAEFVKQFCHDRKIPCFLYSKNISSYSKEKGITFEEAGRAIRYACFYEVLEKVKAQKIAVAQNMDDQAETVLMRLMRGTGLEGIGAMEYIRGKIIRPILNITRKEIENYCSDNNLMARIDKTNLESIYTRNRIRLELIPYIEKNFNKNIKEALCRTAELAREDKDFFDGFVNNVYSDLVIEEKKQIKINIGEFEKQHTAIQNRIIRKVLLNLCGDLKDIQKKHVENLIKFMKNSNTGAQIDLPKEVIAILQYGDVILKKGKDKKTQDFFTYNINIGDEIYIQEMNGYISSKIIGLNEYKYSLKSTDDMYFDADQLSGTLCIRNRKTGDRFNPFGFEGSKKLKDYFIDQKIPKDQRNQVGLVCDDDHILWVTGVRRSNKYKIDKNTKNIVVLTYKEKKW